MFTTLIEKVGVVIGIIVGAATILFHSVRSVILVSKLLDRQIMEIKLNGHDIARIKEENKEILAKLRVMELAIEGK